MEKRYCTLKDVAKEAGVSYATVSNYLNRREKVKKDTGKRIKNAIEKLKYTPALSARHLKLQETNTIGIIVPDIVNNYYAVLVKTLEEIMRKNGYETIIYNTNYLESEEEKALEFFVAKRICGLILMSIKRKFEKLKLYIDSLNLPVVLLDNYVKGLDCWAVVQDNYRGVYKIVEHLITVHGYEKIGFITSNANIFTVQERITGYREALKNFGLQYNKKYVVEGFFDPGHGYEATKLLLGLDDPPEVIVASTSMYTIGIIKAIKESGLIIPGDIAMTSFDDYDFAEIIDPPVTAIKRVDYKIGEMGAKIMLDILKNGKKSEKKIIKIDNSLMLRNSCGCKNKNN